MKRIIILFFTILILTACSSKNDKQFDPSKIDQNLDVIVNNNKVSKSSNPMDY
ncbi:lipoprotein, partial [Paenibacillus sp. MCAF20]